MNADPKTMMMITVEDLRSLLNAGWIMGYSNHGQHHRLYLEDEKRKAFVDKTLLGLVRVEKE